MYHIKDDKRSHISLELIRDGFYSLLEEKDFEALTVSGIAERAGVGRATFYRLFDDKTDILRYDSDQVMDGALRWATDYFSRRESLALYEAIFAGSEFWLREENRVLFFRLEKCGCLDLLAEKIEDRLRRRILPLQELFGFDDREWECFIPIQVAISVTALRTAIRGYPEAPADAVARVVKVVAAIYGDRARRDMALAIQTHSDNLPVSAKVWPEV
ncbi:MAG: TetR/AcrR family transcriptional regulator [Gracilibacteraceae bacterium]|jgi:AcrR family transcriptional regulator|nr:TetR/AcrR family transcriptional regulator [Gracilibacteraceae bacterium]